MRIYYTEQQRLDARIYHFWKRVDFTASCWFWRGPVSQGRGYGLFGFKLSDRTIKRVLAHRFAYELCVGVIPDGMTLDHLCRVRHCVNPDHLEPVSLRENVMRGTSTSAINSRKTQCIRGHPFDRWNTYRNPITGKRYCRICANASSVRYRERMRLRPR